MFLPLLFLFLAALAAALLAYGSHSAWAQYPHGFAFILLTRQLQWPLIALAILFCIALIALVASGKRRAWWLIGLGPILALFCHRFYSDALLSFAILDNPVFVPAHQAGSLSDNDYVVGLTFNSSPYAYPYASLYPCPVVFQADHDKRMILLWSAFANRALAFEITRDLYARDLEILAMPANALLLYNTKLGEFINGVTGLTPDARRPTGLASPIPVEKMPWRQWRAAHPDTAVMSLAGLSPQRKTPNAPLRPAYPHHPLPGNLPPDTRILIIATTRPVALLSDAVASKPLNLSTSPVPVLVFRDPQTARVRAFDRRIDDLIPIFKLNTDPRRRQAFLIDRDSNSAWSSDARALDGHFARDNKRLTPIPVDDGLYWGVMKTWMPDLTLIDPSGLR